MNSIGETKTKGTNLCSNCCKEIDNKYIDIYVFQSKGRYYKHMYLENQLWIRQNIIYLCTFCMLSIKNRRNYPWWEVKIPTHIPLVQAVRYAKRILLGRR